jgi:hypothetical protein
LLLSTQPVVQAPVFLHSPETQDSPDPHAVQAPPPDPQSVSAVPLRHCPPEQQPSGQLAAEQVPFSASSLHPSSSPAAARAATIVIKRL